MNEKPIDFLGIVTLQFPFVKQLEQYLDEKEAILVDRLLVSLRFFRGEASQPPALPSTPIVSFKLSDAAEAFSKRIRLLTENKVSQPPLEERLKVVREVNMALWKYVEVLEGCVVELFQQVKLEGIDQWHYALPKSLEAIKDLLLHRIEDLSWTIRRLENPLWQYRWGFASPNSWRTRLIKSCLFWRNPLDSRLLVNLSSSEQFLKSHYYAFMKRYDQYVRLDDETKNASFRLQRYAALGALEKDDKLLYEQLQHWLNLWVLDEKNNKTLSADITLAIKNTVGFDQVTHLFNRYYECLKHALYALSRELKTEGSEWIGMQQRWKEQIALFVEELQTFMDLMVHYREFLLKTDPNPYIRSRFGFTEWIVGPEPLKTKALTQKIYEAKTLHQQFTAIGHSLEQPDTMPQEELYADMERLLHQMSSPLISREMMRKRGESLIDDLGLCNILGCSHFERVDHVGHVLNQAMRLDWKYHVLHEFSEFHIIVDQYRSLVCVGVDPAHEGRLKQFQTLFFHIKAWLARKDPSGHIQDISIDMNDMKTYLQDFLAAVQRLQKDQSSQEAYEEAIKQFRYQLLEYRYFFGEFFSQLIHSEERTSMQLRNRFLFVDQYFESVELLLAQDVQDT